MVGGFGRTLPISCAKNILNKWWLAVNSIADFLTFYGWWISIKGLPFHLWTKEESTAIGSMSGG